MAATGRGAARPRAGGGAGRRAAGGEERGGGGGGRGGGRGGGAPPPPPPEPPPGRGAAAKPRLGVEHPGREVTDGRSEQPGVASGIGPGDFFSGSERESPRR